MKRSTRNLLIILIILLVIVCLFSFNVNGVRNLFGKKGMPSFGAFAVQSADAVVEEAAYDYAAPMMANASAKMISGANTYYNDADNSIITKSEDGERKIVKNVTMSCETQDFDRVYKKVELMVEGYDGIIDNYSLNNGRVGAKNPRRSCYFNIRVPKDKLDKFITDITKETNVTYKYESTEDITDNYNDTVARYETLKEEEKKLNELIGKADRVEDMVSIEERLSNVRYQMQSIEKRVANMDKTVDYSTVNLDITEVVVLSESKDVAPTKDNLMAAFYKNLEDCKIFLKNIGIYVFTHLPAIVLGIIIFIILLIILIIICAVSDHAGRDKSEKKEKKLKEEKVKEIKEEKKADKPVAKAVVKEEKIKEEKVREIKEEKKIEEPVEEKKEEEVIPEVKQEVQEVKEMDENAGNATISKDGENGFTMTDLDFTL